MQCPVDGTQLMMSERSGVEIDYCPQCRGVWLDRGELDKIIERSAVDLAPPPPPAASPRKDDDGYRRYEDYRGGHGKPYKKRRKESFLSEIFDF